MQNTTDVTELIETLWNVNPGGEPGKMTKEEELIETLWNVNTLEFTMPFDTSLELIETLWNVNASLRLTNVPFFRRINRNIVECK